MYGKGIPQGTLVVVRHPSPWEGCLGIITEKIDGHNCAVSVVSLQGGSRAFTVTINDIGLKTVEETDEIDFITPDEALLNWRLIGYLAGDAAESIGLGGSRNYHKKVLRAEEELRKCRLEK